MNDQAKVYLVLCGLTVASILGFILPDRYTGIITILAVLYTAQTVLVVVSKEKALIIIPTLAGNKELAATIIAKFKLAKEKIDPEWREKSKGLGLWNFMALNLLDDIIQPRKYPEWLSAVMDLVSALLIVSLFGIGFFGGLTSVVLVLTLLYSKATKKANEAKRVAIIEQAKYLKSLMDGSNDMTTPNKT